MMWSKKIFEKGSKGIYVIIDPQQDAKEIKDRLILALTQDITAVQIWDNGIGKDKKILETIKSLCGQRQVPLLINNNWELLQELDFDGIHFDSIPDNWATIKNKLENKIVGITCSNDLSIVDWAEEQKLDYISFCSLFDSKNNSSCDLVDFQSIKRARELSSIPFVLAGGITLDNIDLLSSLDYQAIAMISGVMNVESPEIKINTIYNKMNNG